MQHSLVFIFSRKLMMIFTKTFFMLISLGTSSSVSYQHKNVTLTHYNIVVIESPGYPHRDYERDTNYTWDVRADDGTEEIYITIMMDITETPGFPCEDYLLIQEIGPLSGYFTQFKQCGQRKEHRKTKGNRLLVTLVSNHDELTSRGFKLILYVIKMGSIMSPTKARTTASTKTADRDMTFKTTTTTQILTSLTTPTTTKITSTQSTTSTTPLTTTTTTKSTTPIELTTPSTQTASSLKITDGNNKTISTDPTVHFSQSSRNLYASLNHQSSTKEVTTPRLSSFQSTETQKTSYQTTTETPPNQSSTSETRNITALRDTVSDENAASDLNIFGSLEMKTVILLIGLGVLEVTLIIVGVLAVQRYRRKRKYVPSRQARKRNDDHTNTFRRQNSCDETHVYDEIDIDDVKEGEEESQYKELPEGVYDTTLKRRSHLKVVGERKSSNSRGSIINMFRTSYFFRGKVNETSVMTFSSFRGPIQSQIGEKK